MGRKKKEDKEKEKLSVFEHLQEETLQGVTAIIFFVLGLFSFFPSDNYKSQEIRLGLHARGKNLNAFLKKSS